MYNQIKKVLFLLPAAAWLLIFSTTAPSPSFPNCDRPTVCSDSSVEKGHPLAANHAIIIIDVIIG